MAARLPDLPRLRCLLAFLLGGAGVLAFSPFDAFWLTPLLWGGVFLLLRRTQTPAAAAWVGGAFGLGLMLAGVSWIYISLHEVGGMPAVVAAPAVLALALLMALFPAGAAALWLRWRPAGALRQALLFATLYALADWSRTWFLTGFPWLLVGYTQTPPSPLAAYAPVLGVHGVGWLAMLCGVAWVRWPVGVLVSGLIIGGGVGLNAVRWTAPDGPAIPFSLVQGNVPQSLKFQPDALRDTLMRYRDMANATAARLTVLPETALPVFIDQLSPDYLNELTAGVKARGGDLLVGTVLRDGEAYYNGAVSLGSAPSQAYRKQHLVPFGEFIPTGFRWFVQLAHIPLGDFGRGDTGQAPLAIAGTRVAVNICYEDVFGEELRQSAGEAGVLVNLSNTAWFGRSLAQPQHVQMARMRALETGRPMLRATNTGVTAAIDAQGNIEGQLPEFEQGVLRGYVTPHTGLTPYVRFGNLGFFVLMGLSLLITLLRRPLTRV